MSRPAIFADTFAPTGAHSLFEFEEKKYAKIGSAYIDRSRCIAWEEDRKCLICDEICPYDAIVMRGVMGNTNSVPYVNESRCNGCGYCEQKCPVLGNAAIGFHPTGGPAVLRLLSVVRPHVRSGVSR